MANWKITIKNTVSLSALKATKGMSVEVTIPSTPYLVIPTVRR